MEQIYAAMLLHRAGHAITEDALKKVMSAAGAQTEEIKIKATVAALSGVDIDKVIKEASLVTAAPAAGATMAQAEKKEEKEEEKKVSAEDAAAGLGALFG
ncbi:MAG: 50S ribosomal protein P1 [DPANN group archaeon]|nr:50S ribosomal protein P1 [DPANN group archaeon]